MAAANEAAGIQAAKLGMSIETDPATALSECVAAISGVAAWLRAQVSELDEDKAIENGALHPTLRAYMVEIDRLARVAKTAIDAGVELRREARVEEYGVLVADVLRDVLTDLGLFGVPRWNERLEESLGRHLRSREMRAEARRLSAGGDIELPDDLAA